VSCPHCRSRSIRRRRQRTALGYRRFWCASCRRRFNERTGTPFNDLQHPTDVVLLAVLWRLRYKLSFRDVAELLLQRGFEVTHETVREWEFRFAPLLSEQLRSKRRGRASASWYLDETYVKVAGRWCYLYRAIDRDGSLIDSMLSEHRDSMRPGGSSGGWSMSPKAGRGASRPTCTPRTVGRFAGLSAAGRSTGLRDT
jgi:putative transposase